MTRTSIAKRRRRAVLTVSDVSVLLENARARGARDADPVLGVSTWSRLKFSSLTVHSIGGPGNSVVINR